MQYAQLLHKQSTQRHVSLCDDFMETFRYQTLVNRLIFGETSASLFLIT